MSRGRRRKRRTVRLGAAVMAKPGLPEGTTMQGLRAAVQAWALSEGDYSGAPMPVEDFRLVMAPRHRQAKRWNGATLGQSEGRRERQRSFTCSNEDVREDELVRSWYSRRLNTEVFLVQHGRPGEAGFHVEVVYDRSATARSAFSRWEMAFNTMHVASQAWDLEPELRALATLREHVTEHQFSLYMLTGMMPERSKRSLCSYIFRKGRPTVVMQTNREGMLYAWTALCMHPLAYYNKTHAGGMVPTDDVLAHLLLMRADEARFWRQANQHPLYRVEAGV